jgi:acyl-CoA synthetase (AMP-forming)/AMP-acid ligase II
MKMFQGLQVLHSHPGMISARGAGCRILHPKPEVFYSVLQCCRYGPMGVGAVVHTLNPRLFLADLDYIANHAEDRVLFFDLSFLEIIQQLRPRLKTIKHFVIMTDRAHMPENASKVLLQHAPQRAC